MPGWSGHILEWGGWWKLCSPAGLWRDCGYCNAWALSPLPSLLSIPLPLSFPPGAAGTGVKPAILSTTTVPACRGGGRRGEPQRSLMFSGDPSRLLCVLLENSIQPLVQRISHLWTNELFPVQFSSAAQSCPTLYDPMNHRSTPGLPVHHQLPEFTQTHVHRVGDAIQPSHPLSSPSPPAPNPSQHQSLFQ